MKPRSGGLLVLVALAILLVAYLYGIRSDGGVTVDETPTDDPRFELLTILGDVANRPRDVPGRWRQARETDRVEDEDEDDRLSDLVALPYVQGSRKAPDVKSVTIHDEARAYPGVNTYTSGHAPEAFIMDMDGTVLHRWQFDVDRVWPSVPRTIHSEFWRRVYPYRNGELLAIFEGIGMIKIDRYSRLLWAFRGGCHHEAYVTDDGTIYVLTRRARIEPGINPVDPVLLDAISVLSSDGELLGEYDLLSCFINSEYDHLLKGMPRKGDIFHTNSLYVFDGSLADVSPLFDKGRVLISILKLDVVAILDLEERRAVWAESGSNDGFWKRQHDPRPLPNGHMLLFDNRGHNGTSKVVEFDPESLQIAWLYSGRGDDVLFSNTCGTSRRLPNGNTLITESDNGRSLEVSPDKEIVWEFYNPHRAGEKGELIATLFDLTRNDLDYFAWLELE